MKRQRPGSGQSSTSPSSAPPRSAVAPADPADALVVADLHVHIGAVHILRGVDLRIGRGEVLAVVGESGSGKSTLSLAVQGLLPPVARVSGTIRVNGAEVIGASGAQLRRIREDSLGAVFQDPMTSLNPTMRIGRQIAEAGGVQAPALALERVGIADAASRVRAYPHELSGGQRQRVMVAMATARRPALLLADEPTTALDVTVQAQVLQLLQGLRDADGTAVLFVTHDLGVAAEIADEIAVLYAGRVVERGPAARLLTRPAHPYTAALLGARLSTRSDRSRLLVTLPGTAPSPVEADAGCAFRGRCPHTLPACSAGVPDARPAPHHPGTVACIRAGDIPDQPAVAADRPATPTPGTTDIVRLRDVEVTYPGRGRRAAPVRALRGVDLAVRSGEAVALVGESGSGKSTLLRIVAGLVAATAGAVELPGDRPQLVHQDATASLTPWLTVGELVGERLRAGGASRSERNRLVGEALERVGLSAAVATSKPGRLSGGQRQRVAVARAIVVPPDLLLCDEPVSAMDVSLAAGVLNLLVELRAELGSSLLFVTHDLAAARWIADRIVVMEQGQVVETGDAVDVVDRPRHPYTRALVAAIPGAVVPS